MKTMTASAGKLEEIQCGRTKLVAAGTQEDLQSGEYRFMAMRAAPGGPRRAKAEKLWMSAA